MAVGKGERTSQLQKQEETATDLDVKRALHCMIGVTVEALKLHFKRDELPGLIIIIIIIMIIIIRSNKIRNKKRVTLQYVNNKIIIKNVLEKE